MPPGSPLISEFPAFFVTITYPKNLYHFFADTVVDLFAALHGTHRCTALLNEVRRDYSHHVREIAITFDEPTSSAGRV